LTKRLKFGQALKLLAELGLIILGVLIALAGDSWWNQREDRRLEREYLAQLGIELVATDSALTFAINSDSLMAEDVRALQAVLVSGEQPPASDSAWVRGVYSLAFEDISLDLGTLGTLFQTGDIRLIRSRTIRTGLGSLEARLASHLPVLRSLEELSYAQYRDQILEVYRVEENGVASVQALRASPGYKASIDARGLLLDARVYYHRQLREDIRGVLSALAGEGGVDPSGSVQ